MTMHEINIGEDELVSRSYILKRLNISCGMFKKYQVMGPIRFPEAVVKTPHPRWSLKAINQWLEKNVPAPETANGRYEIVLYTYSHKEPDYAQIRNFAEAVVQCPGLMSYFQHYAFSDEPLPTEWNWVKHIQHAMEGHGSDYLRFIDLPRHHPELIKLIKALPEKDRLGCELVTIPYASYSIYVDDHYGDKLINMVAEHSVNILPPPGSQDKVSVKYVPLDQWSQIMEKYYGSNNDQLKLLMADINNLIVAS